MHFELRFTEYKSIILNIELSTMSYFFIGLGLGLCTFLLYNYFKNQKRS